MFYLACCNAAESYAEKLEKSKDEVYEEKSKEILYKKMINELREENNTLKEENEMLKRRIPDFNEPKKRKKIV